MSDDRDALKQRIKDASDIVDVVGGYISLRPVGPTFKSLCPFHDDHRPSFDVDPRRQRYRCWTCGKSGDVFQFVQEYERVSFREALELLARRAGISLENSQKNPQGPSRAGMLDVMRWAAEQFQQCLLDSHNAENARKYLGERKLTGETVRKFGLGFAPPMGKWLVQSAHSERISLDLLEAVGLIAKEQLGEGHYDRFRDRVMFPIRDVLGRTVGFGGRILPSSPLSADRPPPKYYNSAETSLFSKSDQLYGIDQAKQAAAKAGYVAVVEGYTDVLMAHQHGICQVVATMGTALNARHIKKLKSIASRVVLVFDADAGGEGGVDRAMEVFVSQDLDLRVASLPEGLDPCDLISTRGPERFTHALEEAVDVFEYKLESECKKHKDQSMEGKLLVMDKMLSMMAHAPIERSPKMHLMVRRMVNRIAHRFGQIKEESVWARLKELREKGKSTPVRESSPPVQVVSPNPLLMHYERAKYPFEEELMQLLLADESLVPRALAEINAKEIEHQVIQRIFDALKRLFDQYFPTDLAHLYIWLDNQGLWGIAQDFKDLGLRFDNRERKFQDVMRQFQKRRLEKKRELALIKMKDTTDPFEEKRHHYQFHKLSIELMELEKKDLTAFGAVSGEASESQPQASRGRGDAEQNGPDADGKFG